MCIRDRYRSCILHIDSAFCLSRNGKINASLLADDDKKIAMMDVEGITVYRTHSSNQFVWFESWWGQYYCFAPEKVRSIVISMYVSLFVCLSVCLLAYLENHTNFINFTCLSMWQRLGPLLEALRYIMYTSVFWIMSCFQIVGFMARHVYANNSTTVTHRPGLLTVEH